MGKIADGLAALRPLLRQQEILLDQLRLWGEVEDQVDISQVKAFTFDQKLWDNLPLKIKIKFVSRTQVYLNVNVSGLFNVVVLHDGTRQALSMPVRCALREEDEQP